MGPTQRMWWRALFFRMEASRLTSDFRLLTAWRRAVRWLLISWRRVRPTAVPSCCILKRSLLMCAAAIFRFPVVPSPGSQTRDQGGSDSTRALAPAMSASCRLSRGCQSLEEPARWRADDQAVLCLSGLGPVGSPASFHARNPPSICATRGSPMSSSAAHAKAERQPDWQ